MIGNRIMDAYRGTTRIGVVVEDLDTHWRVNWGPNRTKIRKDRVGTRPKKQGPWWAAEVTLGGAVGRRSVRCKSGQQDGLHRLGRRARVHQAGEGEEGAGSRRQPHDGLSALLATTPSRDRSTSRSTTEGKEMKMPKNEDEFVHSQNWLRLQLEAANLERLIRAEEAKLSKVRVKWLHKMLAQLGEPGV